MSTRYYTVSVNSTRSRRAQKKVKVDASAFGRLMAVKITDGRDFWALIDELIDDNSGFINNRSHLVQAFKNGELYGLAFEESEEISEGRVYPWDGLFCASDTNCQHYLIPMLCVRDGDNVDILWTHSRVRRNGFATELIRQLGLKQAPLRIAGSEAFWAHVDQTMWKSNQV